LFTSGQQPQQQQRAAPNRRAPQQRQTQRQQGHAQQQQQEQHEHEQQQALLPPLPSIEATLQLAHCSQYDDSRFARALARATSDTLGRTLSHAAAPRPWTHVEHKV
jgi:hypothetical protein